MTMLKWLRRGARTAQGGRRGAANRDYIFGEGDNEIARLDMQHYMFRREFGSDVLAPVRPSAALDVACGTGRWAMDLARQFPRAAVTGFDNNHDLIERALADPNLPANCTFLVASALQPFAFADATFDLVMARANSAYVPIARWPGLVVEMTRVTRPGGWVELRDFGLVKSDSPALSAMTGLFAQMAASRGIYPGAASHLEGFLRAAGLRGVRARTVTVRAGQRATHGGRLMIADYLSVMERITPVVAQAGLASEAQWRQWLAQARDETLTGASQVELTAAYGRR